MPDYTKPLPTPDPVTKPFWDSVKAHALQLQKCANCGRFIFYPRAVCPHCFSRDLNWTRVSGRGKIYGFTISHQKVIAAFANDVPYTIALVELEEGARLLTNIVGVEADPAKIRVGMNVVVQYDDVTEAVTLPKFKPL
ncbi:MAG: Zn-ribbon domain-containing OB-fold protein [Chloroflexi bacterium]|nr:Zn-ribbon domain-containing OB-fold protein [Chloroflexota bacterium]